MHETIPETSSEMPHQYDIIPEPPLEADHYYEAIKGIYSKGKPADLTKYNWFHGNISEEQANVALIDKHYGGINTFLNSTIHSQLNSFQNNKRVEVS